MEWNWQTVKQLLLVVCGGVAFYCALQNLAAMNSLQINIDRMNEINESPSQGGETAFAPKGYDIVFDHVGALPITAARQC